MRIRPDYYIGFVGVDVSPLLVLRWVEKISLAYMPTAVLEYSVHPPPAFPALFYRVPLRSLACLLCIGRVLETMGKEGHWARTSTYNTLLWYFRQERYVHAYGVGGFLFFVLCAY